MVVKLVPMNFSNISERVLENKKTSLAGSVGLLSLLMDQKDTEFVQQVFAYLQTLDWHTAAILILSVALLLARDGKITVKTTSEDKK